MRNFNRQCRDCKHYRVEEWSAFSYECKLGHDTPNAGYTEACSDYEEQWTIGIATKNCEDCIHYNAWRLVGSQCEKGFEIPESKHACNEFEGRSNSYTQEDIVKIKKQDEEDIGLSETTSGKHIHAELTSDSNQIRRFPWVAILSITGIIFLIVAVAETSPTDVLEVLAKFILYAIGIIIVIGLFLLIIIILSPLLVAGLIASGGIYLIEKGYPALGIIVIIIAIAAGFIVYGIVNEL